MKVIKNQKGFTLMELLVVIAIIAIMSTVVYVALDPVKRFADARDARRWSDVNSISTAIHEYVVDNDGSLPSPLTTSYTKAEIGSCGTCANLATPLVTYLKSMPLDPASGTSATNTGYYVTVNAQNMVTVSADNAENTTIEVSR